MKRGHSRWPARRRLRRLRLLLWLPRLHESRGGGALSILQDKHSSGARECGLADLLRAAVPDGLSLPHLHLNIFFYDFIFIYLNSRVIHTYQCTTPVNLLWRTGVGPMLQPSNRFRPSCGVLPHAHWDMEANDGILWTALVTWHFWHHFMLVVVSLAAN